MQENMFKELLTSDALAFRAEILSAISRKAMAHQQ